MKFTVNVSCYNFYFHDKFSWMDVFPLSDYDPGSFSTGNTSKVKKIRNQRKTMVHIQKYCLRNLTLKFCILYFSIILLLD